ncbi:conserved Plasmodium protein, unknown function [Plasmodium relictum]|uniref:Kinesin motor domain-containing protein n=1 Tax=Plasmodium relictum TaxID=85471 RepID=A0A1J1H522_PLARL|nr:conserved Plasmodium protein, unknown function [Plasmodium relictum]CRG99651.1 conserved Plasmodium protein, unknown function [Plasmodium relictum]
MSEFVSTLEEKVESKEQKNSLDDKYLNTKKGIFKSLNHTTCNNNLVSLNKYDEDAFVSKKNCNDTVNTDKYSNDLENFGKLNNIISELKFDKNMLHINKYEFENEELFSSMNDLAESIDTNNLTYDDEDEREKKNDFNNNDDKHNCEVIIRIKPRKMTKINEDEIKNSSYHDDKNIKYNNNCIYIHNTNFLFDRVFSEETKQEEVYSYLSNKFLNNLFEGYNCTIFAYGQTGSGKTFTMGFDYINEFSENTGILPRFLNDMYKIIEKKKKNHIYFDVSCTYIEIYNEEIVDLIDFDELSYNTKVNKKNGKNRKKSKINKNISIREDINKKEIILMGVKNEKVENVQDIFSILHRGNLFRTTEKTFMNDKSSRSHAIFTINLIQRKKIIEKKKKKEDNNNERNINNKEKSEEDNDNITENINNGNDITCENDKINKEEIICSKFHFVDLAGSERAKRTETQGNRLKEAININYGLLSLSNVIYSLSNYKKSQHIPYRNSKLTRILQDSLGGNSKTVMIACISINPEDFYETLSTIKYASRTKKIKNNPVINYDVNSLVINELRKQLYSLNLELKKYKVGCKDKCNELEINNKFKEIADQNNLLMQKIKSLKKKRKKLICLIFYYLTLLKNENKFSYNEMENSNFILKHNYMHFHNKLEDNHNKNFHDIENIHFKKNYNKIQKSKSLNMYDSKTFNNHMYCDDLKNSNRINNMKYYNWSCDSFFLKNNQNISDNSNKNTFIEYYNLICEKNKTNGHNYSYRNNNNAITKYRPDVKINNSISNNIYDSYINTNDNEINIEKNNKKEHGIVINNSSYDINKIEKSVYNENIPLKQKMNESSNGNICESENNNRVNSSCNVDTSNINDALNKMNTLENNFQYNDSFNKNHKICELCEKKNVLVNDECDSDFNFFEKKHLFINFEEDKKNVEKIFRQYELNHYNEKKLKDLNKKYNIIFEKNKVYEKKIEELKKMIKKVKKYSKTDEKNKKKKKKIKKDMRINHYNSNLLKKLLFYHINEYNFSFKYKRNCFSDIEFEREIKNKMPTHFIKKNCSDTEINNKKNTFPSYIKKNYNDNIQKIDVLYRTYIDYKKGKFSSLNRYCNSLTVNNYENNRDILEKIYSSENDSSSNFLYLNNIDNNFFENKDKISDFMEKENEKEKKIKGTNEYNYNKKLKKNNLDIIDYLDNKKIKNNYINEKNTFDSSEEDINYNNISPKFLKNKLHKLQKIIKEELSKFKRVNKEKEEYNAKNELLTNNIMNLKKKLHFLQVNSQTDKNYKKIENMKNEILKITNEKEKIQKKLNDNEQKIKHLKVDIMKMKNNFLKTSKILKEEQRKHNNIIRKKENIITKLHEREEIFINKLKKKEEISKQAYSKLLKRNQELNEELRKLKKKGVYNKMKKNKRKKVEEHSIDINKKKEITSSKCTDKKKLNKVITSDELYDTKDNKNYEINNDFIISSSSILSNDIKDSYLNSISSFCNSDDSFSTYSPFKYNKEENLFQHNSKKDLKIKNYLKEFLKKKKKLSSIKLKIEKEKDMNRYIRKILQALYLKKKNENEHLNQKNYLPGENFDKKMNEIKDNIKVKENGNLNEDQNTGLVENKEHNSNKYNEDLVSIKSYINESYKKEVDNHTYICPEEKIDDDVLYYENKLSQSNELIKKLKKHLNTKKEESILQKNVKYLLKQLYYNFKKRKENEKKVKSLKKFIYSENLFISKIYNNFFNLNNTINNYSNVSIYSNYLNYNNVQFYSNEINNAPSKSKSINLSNSHNSKENNVINDILLLHNYDNCKKEFSKNLSVSLFDSKRRHTFSSPRELGENVEKNNNTINLKKRSYKSRLMENIYLDHFNKKRIILSKNSNFYVNNDCIKYNKRYSDCLSLNKNINNYSYVNKPMAVLKSLDKLSNNFEKIKHKENLENENSNLIPLNSADNKNLYIDKNNRRSSSGYNHENSKETFDDKKFLDKIEHNMICNLNIKRKTIDNCFLYLNKINNKNFYYHNDFSDCDKENKNEKKKDFIELELRNNLYNKSEEAIYGINPRENRTYSYSNIYDKQHSSYNDFLTSTNNVNLLKNNKDDLIFSNNENNRSNKKVVNNNSSDSNNLSSNSYIHKININDNHEVNNILIKNIINNDDYVLNNRLGDDECNISYIKSRAENSVIMGQTISVNDNSKNTTKIKKNVLYDEYKECLKENKFDSSIVSRKMNKNENEKNTNLNIILKLNTPISDGIKKKEQKMCYIKAKNCDNKKSNEHNKNLSKEKDKNLNDFLDQVNFMKKENLTDEETKIKKKENNLIEEIKNEKNKNSIDNEANIVKKENINNIAIGNIKDRNNSDLINKNDIINKAYSTQLDEDTGIVKEKGNIKYNEVFENNLISGVNKYDMEKKERIYQDNISVSKNKINDIPTAASTNNLNIVDNELEGKLINNANDINARDNLIVQRNFKTTCIKNCHKYGVSGLCIKEMNSKKLKFLSSSINSIKLWDDSKVIWNYDHNNVLKNEKSTFISSLIISFQNNCFFAGINSYVHLFDIRMNPNFMQKYYYSDKNDSSLLVSLLNNRSDYIPLLLRNQNLLNPNNIENKSDDSNQNSFKNYYDDLYKKEENCKIENNVHESNFSVINESCNDNENYYLKTNRDEEKRKNYSINNEIDFDENIKEKFKAVKEVEKFQSEYCICACGSENFIKVFDIRKNDETMWLAKVPITNKIEYITHIPIKKNIKNVIKDSNILKNIIIASRDKTVKIWKKGWVSFYPPSYDWCTSLSHFNVNDLMRNKNFFNFIENSNENKDAFNYDSLIVSGSRDSHLRFWLYSNDNKTNEFNRFMKIIKNAHLVDITSICKYKNNNLITTDRDGFIQMWNCNLSINDNEKSLLDLEFYNNQINLTVNKIGKTFRHSSNAINKIACYENNFITASSDGSVKLFCEK